MSASHDQTSGWYYAPTIENDEVLALVEANFDEVTTYQSQVIAREVEADARYRFFMRRLCILRTITFPVDYIGTLFLLGRDRAQKRFELQKVLWAFIRGKATKQELAEAIESGF